MDPVDQEIQLIKATLSKLIVEDVIRLQTGVKRREQMFAALEEMGPSALRTNYRYCWLQRCIPKVIELLVSLATEFNILHADDMASGHDLNDILVSTTKALNEKLQRAS